MVGKAKRDIEPYKFIFSWYDDFQCPRNTTTNALKRKKIPQGNENALAEDINNCSSADESNEDVGGEDFSLYAMFMSCLIQIQGVKSSSKNGFQK